MEYLIAFILTGIKDAFTKDNLVKSPTTAIAYTGTGLGTYGIVNFNDPHEVYAAIAMTLISAVLFFINDRKVPTE